MVQLRACRFSLSVIQMTNMWPKHHANGALSDILTMVKSWLIFCKLRSARCFTISENSLLSSCSQSLNCVCLVYNRRSNCWKECYSKLSLYSAENISRFYRSVRYRIEQFFFKRQNFCVMFCSCFCYLCYTNLLTFRSSSELIFEAV